MERIFLYPYAGPGGRNYIRQMGTKQDLALTEVNLKEGMRLGFCCDDADNAGNPDDLLFEGVIHFDAEKEQWYVVVDESSYRHASDAHRAGGSPAAP